MSENFGAQFFPAACPRCGAVIPADSTQPSVLCNYCGCQFQPQPAAQPQFQSGVIPEQPQKRTLGQKIKSILIFPVPVTKWLMRDRDMTAKYPKTKRIGMAAGAWAIYALLIVMFGMLLTRGHGTQPEMQERMQPEPTVTEEVPQTSKVTTKATTTKTTAETTESTESETETTAKPKETEIDESVLTPKFKAMMDSYEAFFDEYIAFMQKYMQDGNPAEMLSDYLDWLNRYADYIIKLDDAEDEAVTLADIAYYAEVNARILKKLAEFEASIPDEEPGSFSWDDYDPGDFDFGDYDFGDYDFGDYDFGF